MSLITNSIYEAAINFANIYTWDYDMKQHIIYNADSLEKYFAATYIKNVPDSLIEKNLFDKEDIFYIEKSFEDINNGNPDNVHECWFNFFNGEIKYLKVKYFFEYDSFDNPVTAHAFAIDLTEQKNAEKVFRQRTKALLNANHDALITFSVNITEDTCNSISCSIPKFRNILAATTFDEIKEYIIDLISDKNERNIFIDSFSKESLYQAFENGMAEKHFEHHLKLGVNNEQWVLTRLDFVQNPVTKDIEAFGHINNINYQKTIHGLINGTISREYDFIALYYLKTDNYIIVDKYNSLGNNVLPDFIYNIKNYLRNSISDDNEYLRVCEFFDKERLVDDISRNGESIIRYNTCADEKRNHHKIIRLSFLNSKKNIITISCRDITSIYIEDQKQKAQLFEAIESAEKANKAKSEFLSLVSHDIRTPLNGIMGMLQLASDEKDIRKIKDYIDKASLSSDFLLGLINDLLDLSKMESGKMELSKVDYSYSDMISYINSVVRPICKKKNQKFSIHAKNIFPYIVVDELRLNQILFNLLSNASKYTQEGGNIQLKIIGEKIDSEMAICKFIVKDDGIGMTEAFKKVMFDSFSQEKRMNLSVNEGSGLGLSITKNLIEIMGGTITVNSEVDKGTEFEVLLTVSYKEELLDVSNNNKKSKSINEVNFEGKNFLLCEDNEINQEIIIEIMKSVGANVEVADDGLIGLAKYKEKKAGYYSCIFMDIRMPNMDGLQTSKEIRKCKKKDSSSIPIIAMTANAMSKDKMECIEAGMNAFVSKPINIKELYKVMSDVIK